MRIDLDADLGEGVSGDREADPERLDDLPLPSEPVVLGSILAPPDGQLVVLGPEAPINGGYPVIAVLLDADVDRLAHVVPGQILDIRETNTDVPEMNVL
jgi:allophanate hydrolase subunit 2